MSAQSNPSADAGPKQPALAQPPMVACDLCSWPMPVPQHCVEQGEIAGLLVCTLCTEENLSAATFEPRAEVGLVGGGA